MTDTMTLEGEFVLPTYAKFPVVIERGAGNYVFDERGRRYLDFYAGHAVALLGHSPKDVVAALHKQADRLLFYSNLAYSRVRAEAAQSLVSLCEVRGGKVFFCNSGAEANENAMRIARRVTGRPNILAMSGSFHGRSSGALAATGLRKYRKGVAGLGSDTGFMPYGDLRAAERAVDSRTAGVLVEAIQSMAGVVMPPEGYLGRLQALCRERGALLIFDEVQTGLGRTGAPSAARLFGVVPQMQTFAKGLGSGFPCGAVVAARELTGKLKPGDLGSTFGGGPLACAAIRATTDAIRRDRLWENAAGMEALIRESFRFPRLREIRGRGLLLGLVFDRPARVVRDALLKKRVLVGLSDDPAVVRLLPPLTIGAAEVLKLKRAIKEALA